MYEPITVVKVRKATKVTVPAGGWVLIGQPDEPLHAQIERRSGLLKDGMVNDDFEALLIGRIQATHPATRFLTTAQAKASVEHAATLDKNLGASHADAMARQKDQTEKATAKAADEHKAKVEELNEQNDAIRMRDPHKPVKLGVQLEPGEGESSDADDLAGKTIDELKKLIADFNADHKNKITVDPKATKEEIIAAILEGTKAEAEKAPGFFKKLLGLK